jgi:hypothetical protein
MSMSPTKSMNDHHFQKRDKQEKLFSRLRVRNMHQISHKSTCIIRCRNSEPYTRAEQSHGMIQGVRKLQKGSKGKITVTQPPTFRHIKMDLPAPLNLPPDVITTILDHSKHVSMVAMDNASEKMPYEWQSQIRSHLSLMKKLGTSLLIRPTRGDKQGFCT